MGRMKMDTVWTLVSLSIPGSQTDRCFHLCLQVFTVCKDVCPYKGSI